MPFVKTRADDTDNPALAAIRRIESRYPGELSVEAFSEMFKEIEQSVGPGKYLPVGPGALPVCLVKIIHRINARSIEDIYAEVAATPIAESGHMHLEDFLAAYKFFATDCAS